MPGILVGIDGSDHSRRALEWAAQEAATRHLPLTVLTVYQPVSGYWAAPAPYAPDPDLAGLTAETVEQETEATLDKLSAESRPTSVSVRAVAGLPAEEIMLAAAEADMIVVGSRGAGGFKRLLMGSVSTQVVHHAHCPVVVIPSEEC